MAATRKHRNQKKASNGRCSTDCTLKVTFQATALYCVFFFSGDLWTLVASEHHLHATEPTVSSRCHELHLTQTQQGAMESDSQPTRRLAFRSPRIGSTIEVFWDDPGQWYAAIVLRELPDEGQAVFEVEYPESRTQTDFVTSQEVLSQSTWNKLWRWHNRSASTGTDTQLKNGTSDYVALHKLVQAGRIPLGNEVLQVQFEVQAPASRLHVLTTFIEVSALCFGQGARWRVDVLEDALCRESGTTGPIFTDPAMLTLALKRRISPGKSNR